MKKVLRTIICFRFTNYKVTYQLVKTVKIDGKSWINEFHRRFLFLSQRMIDANRRRRSSNLRNSKVKLSKTIYRQKTVYEKKYKDSSIQMKKNIIYIYL